MVWPGLVRTIFGRLPFLIKPRAEGPGAGRPVVAARNANIKPQQLTRHDQSAGETLDVGPGLLLGVTHPIPPGYSRPEHLLIFFLYRLCLLIIKLVWLAVETPIMSQ